MKDLMELVEAADVSTDYYYKTDENVERASELESLGFKKLAQEIMDKVEQKEKLNVISKMGYLKITPDKIKAYLKMKADRYNREHKKDTGGEDYRSSIGVDLATRTPYLGSGRSLDAMRQRQEHFAELAQHMASGRMFTVGIAEYIRPFGDDSETFTERTCDFMKSDGIGQYQWTEKKIEDYESIPPKDALDLLKEHQERKCFDYFTIASVKGVPDPLLLGRIDGSDNRYFIAQWGDDICLEDVL